MGEVNKAAEIKLALEMGPILKKFNSGCNHLLRI